MSKRYGQYLVVMLVIQYTDCIVTDYLSDPGEESPHKKITSKPPNMLKRHIIRGSNNDIYFGEKGNGFTKLYKLSMSKAENDYSEAEAIYQFPAASIVAIEPDYEFIQDELSKNSIKRSDAIYILLDNMQIYHLIDKEGDGYFEQEQIINFSNQVAEKRM